MDDLRSYQYLPIIDNFIEDFKRDTIKSEIRLALFEKLTPVIKKSQANRFVQILQDTIGNDANDSIFKNNINPLRLGLMLIKTINDIQVEYGYSKSTVMKMQNEIEEQMV